MNKGMDEDVKSLFTADPFFCVCLMERNQT